MRRFLVQKANDTLKKDSTATAAELDELKEVE
jgi:hypothetical protein